MISSVILKRVFAMFPYFEFAGLTVSMYGLCTSAGLVLMALTAFLLGRRHKILIEDIIFGELFSLLGAFIGAHILYALTNADKLANAVYIFFKEKRELGYLFGQIGVYAGGMVFYGGLIMGLLFGMLYCKFRKIKLGVFADCFAVAIPLFHAFGRIGCFLSGCCYGIESKLGFTATEAIVQSCNHINRFPVQLLESFLNIVIFVILLVLFRKGIITGRLMPLYLIMYPVVRFFDEFLRGDEYRGMLLGLSTSQWISVIICAAAVIILVKNKRKPVR